MNARTAVLSLLLVCVFVPSARAKAPREPRIRFEQTTFDFGVLIQGATAQRTFTFRNAGRAPLEIQSVNTSCGCTAAVVSDKTVPPGKTGRIEVGYDSRGKMGDINKIVIVRSNDPKEPVLHLTVQGLVVASQHPEMTGSQNLLQGACRSCHVERGLGKTGEDLYRADCAMCHEHHRMGGKFVAPGADDMTGLPAKALTATIAEGRAGTSMPAYHARRGGPLTDEDIDSLVRFIRSRER